MHKLNLAYLRMQNTMWDLEDQLLGALPKFIEHTHNTALKKMLTESIDITQHHKRRLEELLSSHNYSIVYERDMSFATLTQDILSEMGAQDDQHVKDAYLCASCQVIIHMHIARYRTLQRWAKELEDSTGETCLGESLHDAEHMSKELFAIAEGGLFTIGLDEKATLTGDI